MYRQILASFLLLGFLLTPVISAPNSKSLADDIGDVRIIGGDYMGYEDGDIIASISTFDIATAFYVYDNVSGILTIDYTFSSIPVVNSSTNYAFELIFSSTDYLTEISITLREDLHSFVIYTDEPGNFTRKKVNATYTIQSMSQINFPSF